MGKKITFVNLCGPDFHSKSIPPLGLCSITSYLIHTRGIPEQQIGFVEDLLFKAERAARNVIEQEPEFVGISTLSGEQTVPNIYLMMRIKEELPDVCILTGGAHASGIAESYLKYAPWLDIVVVGDGELPLAYLLDIGLQPQRDKKWGRIPNLIFRKRTTEMTNEIIITEQKPLEVDMRQIKSYYPAHNMEFHTTFTLGDMFEFSGMGVNIPIETSRGCSNSCNFCMMPWLFKRRYRYRPVKAIIKDLLQMEAQFGEDATGKPARFIFWDANFGMNPSWRAEWVQALRKLGKKFEWECESRVDRLDNKVMEHFAEVGLIQTLVGIEAGSQRVREHIHNKKLDLQQLLRILGQTKDKIHYVLSFIFGAPSETIADLQETVALGQKINQELGLTYPQHEFVAFPFKIYPKTYLTEHLDMFASYGTKLLVKKEWWMDPNALNWYTCHIQPSKEVTREIVTQMIGEFYINIHGKDYNRERVLYEGALIESYRKTFTKYSRLIAKAIAEK
ncbi:MAG: B12-binding domain-containing radical SAM protein [Candidatus Helarchaeota archaeon]